MFDALKGKLDGQTFYLYGMKEPDYVMKFLTMFGTENRMGKEQIQSMKVDGTTQKFRFKYPEICYLHYQNRDAVDAHNGRRMFLIAIEEQWKMMRWSCCVFQVFLAVADVNCNFARHNLFKEELEEQVNFQFNLAEELIHNSNIEKRDRKKSGRAAKKAGDKIKGHDLFASATENFQGNTFGEL